MAEGYIDLSPITNGMNRINSNINTVNENIQTLSSQIHQVDSNVENVRKQAMGEIALIKAKLIEMMKTQKFQAALQIATTEVIRVRQELEQKFGTQKLVRDSLLGILQAADLSLITESTISKCTEELMISAPKYWLAPCLIALAAWISNNESLANRAITEACKRNPEKTCLLFALITRRVNVGRQKVGKPSSDVVFKWLAQYFKRQDPERMNLNIIAFIDAYSNGIFGEDKGNLCEDQIEQWMESLQAKNPAFAEEQKNYWENVFASYCDTSSVSPYKELKQVCQPTQFQYIADYLVRIDASKRDSGIKSYIDGIMNEEVDKDKLLNDIDDQLVRLVNEYEEDEVGLREEEERLSLIKEFAGDEEKADRIIAARKSKQEALNAPVDFAQRLSRAILDKSASNSAKISAIRLLKPYISEAFNSFITANKGSYPEVIDLCIKNEGKDYNSSIPGVGVIAKKKSLTWTGQTSDSSNRQELTNSLKSEYEKTKKERVAAVTDEVALKKKKTGLILCCTIIGAIFGLPMFLKGKKMLEENNTTRSDIIRYYDKACSDATVLLNRALDQRVEINNIVSNFTSDATNETITL